MHASRYGDELTIRTHPTETRIYRWPNERHDIPASEIAK